MSSNRRYEKYRINPSVIDRALWAFNEHFWQRGNEVPDAMKDEVKAGLECAVRAAVNAGRTNGWFERKDIPEGEKQSYKVHLFAGEGEASPLRSSKYGFNMMQLGSSYMVECDDLPKLRAAATSYAKDHGIALIVNKCIGGAMVTRADRRPL